jgi:hypothetical protein
LSLIVIVFVFSSLRYFFCSLLTTPQKEELAILEVTLLKNGADTALRKIADQRTMSKMIQLFSNQWK